MNIGVLWTDASCAVADSERQYLANWLQIERISVLTGSFCGHKRLVEDLAVAAGAIGDRPFFTELFMEEDKAGNWCMLHHPSYLVFFGSFVRIQPAKELYQPCPDWLRLGNDIIDELVDDSKTPLWKTYWRTDDAFADPIPGGLGTIKGRKQNFKHWLRCSWQCPVWVGSSMPSKKSWSRWKNEGRHWHSQAAWKRQSWEEQWQRASNWPWRGKRSRGGWRHR